jgi:hypothetical protein
LRSRKQKGSHKSGHLSHSGTNKKNKLRNLSHLPSPKSDRQLTTFTTQLTTTSPQKHHVLPPVSAETPVKTPLPPQPAFPR